ncbi:QWRF motif-containing protein 2-like [Wolffia australiana]
MGREVQQTTAMALQKRREITRPVLCQPKPCPFAAPQPWRSPSHKLSPSSKTSSPVEETKLWARRRSLGPLRSLSAKFLIVSSPEKNSNSNSCPDHHLKTLVEGTKRQGLVSPSSSGRPPEKALSVDLSLARKKKNSSSNSKSFWVDGYLGYLQKGKKCESYVENAHQLRLLENKYLQWVFVNARASASMAVQSVAAKKVLVKAWVNTSKIRDSVVQKRTQMGQMQQELKMSLILESQMTYLQEWVLLEDDHFDTLEGATEALKSSSLRLPITDGARADFHSTKSAIQAAAKVMQEMRPIIRQLLPDADSASSVASDLVATLAREKTLLENFYELLSFVAKMKVKQSSLRAHLIQLRQDQVIRPTCPKRANPTSDFFSELTKHC